MDRLRQERLVAWGIIALCAGLASLLVVGVVTLALQLR